MAEKSSDFSPLVGSSTRTLNSKHNTQGGNCFCIMTFDNQVEAAILALLWLLVIKLFIRQFCCPCVALAIWWWRLILLDGWWVLCNNLIESSYSLTEQFYLYVLSILIDLSFFSLLSLYMLITISTGHPIISSPLCVMSLVWYQCVSTVCLTNQETCLYIGSLPLYRLFWNLLSSYSYRPNCQLTLLFKEFSFRVF